MTRLLIAGATGLIGSLALEQALADDRVRHVVALTRRPIEPHAKLNNIVLDFASLPEEADWWKVDGVISALGTTRAITPSPADYRAIDFDYPLSIARAARAHGAEGFGLVSSLGADPKSLFAYTRLKGQLETAIRQLDFPSLTIARPSVLSGRRDALRSDEGLANAALTLFGPILPKTWRISPAETVAAALLKAVIARQPGLHIKHNADMAV